MRTYAIHFADNGVPMKVSDAAVNSALRNLSLLAGGATLIRGGGAWLNAGVLEREPAACILVHGVKPWHHGEIMVVADNLKRDLKESAVGVASWESDFELV